MVATLAALPATAFAHAAGVPIADHGRNDFELWLLGFIVASALLYARGVVALWRKAGVGRGIRIAQVARFVLGWVTLVAALLSPIDELAGRSFAMHMLQHELMMVLAAPLLVLARPLEAWAWAAPVGARRAFAAFASVSLLRGAWRRLTGPLGASCVHALALWIWHLPALFVAALASEPLHVLQHVCFFASALAFWWAVFGRGARAPDAVSVACLFVTMLHTSALGALLTFAPAAWYASGTLPAPFDLALLEDQQLGGLVMWVPGSLAYVVATLAVVSGWLSSSRLRHDFRGSALLR
jgi:cytochrome c oxidase assembly factor CtaG